MSETIPWHERLDKALRSPFWAGVNVLIGVFAGLLGALFHDELSQSVPLVLLRDRTPYIPYEYWSWTAFFFWVFFTVFALVWARREAIAARDRANETASIKTLIETVAPPDFLELYEEVYKRAVQLEFLADSDDIDNPDEELRWVLDCVIQLARRWDYSTQISRDYYRANVMIDRDDTPKQWGPAVEAAAFHCYGEANWPAIAEQAEGGLWVEPDFATADAADGSADDDIDPLLLVYSRRSDVDINIGGAPEAFVAGNMIYLNSIEDIANNMPSGLPAASESAIRAFYERDARARSVISLPIPGEREPGKLAFVGVLNIYRDSPGIMGSAERAASFARLLAPFTVILGRITVKLAVTV
ncbi:MAG: hypothetical protein AAGH76_00975 [Pseudomonadota bacterium]